MDSITLAFVCLVGMIALMAIRVPIAIALGLTSFAGIWALKGLDTSLRVVGSTPFEFSASWNLSAIPMFLLMGGIAFRGGLTSSLFDAARLWLARLPGGLAVAANFASAMFAAASGSSVATAAAMGRLAIPEMLRYRYNPALATATVAAAGTLGSMIPPSIAFVIFGWYTETPIGKLLIAGIFPGLLNAALFAAFIITYCVVKPDAAPPPPDRPTLAEKFAILLKVWPIPALILCVIGGIYSGLTTATEAAAFGAFCAMIIAWLRGGLTRQTFKESIVDTLHSGASIFLIAVSAVLLTRFLALAGLPQFMGDMVKEMELGAFGVIFFMVVIYLILGCFLDPIGIMLITLPILLPMWKAAGLDLIWMGVLVVMLLEIGLLTPPVGLNAFVIKSVVGDAVPLSTIFRGLLWFIAVDIVVVILLVAFPQISLYLPSLLE
ncbi:TRAP transporter large permease [Reyranella sp.]|uniref:TRAP transporter large permease n=1 Tax=Reyranella sp. TaxID=1929291 RepID=UPI003BA8F24F